MSHTDLLETEKNVLYGLVRYPLATDSELARSISMKSSTVAAVRRKLFKEGFCESRLVPFLQDLNCELLMVSYMALSSPPSVDERLKKSRQVLDRSEFVYGLTEPRQDCLFQMSCNFTDAKRNIEDLEKIYRENGYLEEEVTSVAIPFQLSEVHRYFDYESLLREAFWPGKDSRVDDHSYFNPGSPMKLRNKEKVIFQGMCDAPLLNDVELAEKLGVSRMTVGRARKRFFELGLISHKIFPSLDKLGFELLTLTHGRFNPDLTEGLKHYLPRLTEVIGPSIFLASTRDEIVFISAFRDFTEYRRSLNRFSETYKEKELFSSPANVKLFSTREMRTTKDHEYGSFVGKALGVP